MSIIFSAHASSKLKNIDRETGRDISVTVDGLTITITDYKLLKNDDPHIVETQEVQIENRAE